MSRSNSQKQLRFSSPGAVARAKLRASWRRERKRKRPRLFEEDPPPRKAHGVSAAAEARVRARNRALLSAAISARGQAWP